MDDLNERVLMAQILTRYRPMIQDYAFAIVRDFHLAEDVYQEVAVIIAQRWQEMPKDEALAPWLRSTTRHRALKTLEQRKRAPLPLPEETLARIEGEWGDDPGESRKQELRREALQRCLEKLEGTARQVIQERYREGRSCEEIAERVRRSIQSVYAILKRTRLALSECADRSLIALE